MSTTYTESQSLHKPHSPEARLIAVARVVHPEAGERPGRVAATADISRQSLYQWHKRAQGAFLPVPPGPRPGFRTEAQLRARISELEALTRTQAERLAELEGKLARAVEITSTRLWSLILVMAVCTVSHRDMQRIIEVAFGKAWVPSLGTLSNRLEVFGKRAAGLLARARREVGARIFHVARRRDLLRSSRPGGHGARLCRLYGRRGHNGL